MTDIVKVQTKLTFHKKSRNLYGKKCQLLAGVSYQGDDCTMYVTLTVRLVR